MPSLFAGCPDVFGRFEQIRLIETAHREADSIRVLPFRKKRGAALGAKAASNAGFGIEPSDGARSEEHTSELQSLMRISYAVFCLKKKNKEQFILNIEPNQQQVQV